jgi:hypothetical protein
MLYYKNSKNKLDAEWFGSNNNILLKRKNKMFNFNSVVEQVAKASKQPLSYVEDKKVRSSLETLIDTTAEFTITVYNTNLELAKQVVENTKAIDYTKFFATK